MSQVLYRKYRPRTFKEVIGQEHIVKTLLGALEKKKVGHAYLFSGPRGTGKTTLARLLAKAVNCTNFSGEPCNDCESCQEINGGQALDLIEIDAASNRGIDEIRALREGIRFSPAKSRYKVFIIDEAHMLTKEAFNALLKTLEEPPAHAIFVLATTEIEKVPATIISRCQRFDFKKLTFPQITARLKILADKENLKIEETVLRLIAAAAEGSIRDAESLLDQVISLSGKEITLLEASEILGISSFEKIKELFDYLAEKNTSAALNHLQQIQEANQDLNKFLKSCLNYLRRLLILQVDPNLINLVAQDLTEEQVKIILDHAKKFSSQDLQRLVDLFLETESLMRRTSHPSLPLELAIVEYINP